MKKSRWRSKKIKRIIFQISNIMSSLLVKLIPTSSLSLKLGRLFFRLNRYRFAAICCHRAMRLEDYKFEDETFVMPKRGHFIGKCPEISVIIPTYNRAESLERCLNSIVNQTLSQDFFEVIVVNNNCTDNTHQICGSFSKKIKNFKEIEEKTSGLLAGRHAGWRNASADILTFCDDDIEAFPEWLETIVNVFNSRPDVVIAGGNCVGKFEQELDQSFADLWADHDGIFRSNGYYSLIEGITEIVENADPNYIYGCNYSVRRNVIEKAMGYGPDCMKEIIFQGDGENRVCKISRTYGKAVLHPGISVFHNMPESRMNKEYLYKRGFYNGVEASYNFYRRDKYAFLFQFDQYLIKENKLLAEHSEGYNKAVIKHLDALISSFELRKWVMRPQYIGFEQPPALEINENTNLFSRLGW